MGVIGGRRRGGERGGRRRREREGIEQTVKYCLIFGIPKSFPYICIKIEKKSFHCCIYY